MRWSFKIGRILGIDVFLHATFVVMLAFIAVAHWTAHGSLAAVIGGVGFSVVLFKNEPGRTAIPVLNRGEIAGLVTAENVGELLMIRSARMQMPHSEAAPPAGHFGTAKSMQLPRASQS